MAALTVLGGGVLGGGAAHAGTDVTVGIHPVGPAIAWDCTAVRTDVSTSTDLRFTSCLLEVPAQGIYSDSANLEQTDALGHVGVTGWAAVGYDGHSPITVCWTLELENGATESGCAGTS